MKSLNSFVFPLFLIFFISDPCQAFFQSEYMITDLESLDSAGFTNEANSWTYQGVSCPECIFSMPPGSSCGSVKEVFGGPEITPSSDYFQKEYAPSVAGWGWMGVAFEVWAFATSEWTDAASVAGGSIIQNTLYSGGVFELVCSCSTDFVSSRGSHIKYIYKYNAKVVFSRGTSPANPIKFGFKKSTSSYSPPLASLDSIGLRNLGIYNLTSVSSRGTTNLPCNAGYRWNGTDCDACQDGCLSCSGPSQGQCTACKTTLYDYGNGSCLATACSGSFELIPNTKKCTKKCLTGFLWVRNLSCIEACEEPLVKSVNSYNTPLCSSPCADLNQYVYPDKSCSSTCNPLLKEINEPTIKLCLSPCQTSSMFLYPDGSCGDTCPTPLEKKLQNGTQYCENPCFENNTFLYEDGTCKESCASPSIAKDDPVIGKTCKLPCSDKDDSYYNPQSGKCTKTCEYPGEAVESSTPKLCVSSLSEEEVKQVKAIADAANKANTASGTIAMIWSFLSSSDSTSACLGPLAKMLQYIKFMDIMFPEKVLILMNAQSKDSGGFATKMMKDVLKKFPSHELPRKFKIYQASSSFFVNFWPALFNLSVILLMTVFAIVLTAYTKGHAKINSIFKNLTDTLKWNVFLITFSGSIGDIILFTALEFQTMQFDNAAAIFSFLLCLGINTLAVLVVIKIIDVNSAIRKSKKSNLEEEQKKSIEQQWSSYKALFECYKDYSFYQQIFLFVFLIRLALFNAVIGYFYNYPLFQATTAVVSNVLMLGYLVTKRPMKKLVNLMQQIVLELVLLPFNVCVLALAIMDYHEIADKDRRKSIGDVMVYINLIVPILSMVLMAAKAIVMGVDFYKSWKQAKANKIKKLASVQKNFRPNDLLNTTEEQQFPTQTDASSSPSKGSMDPNQILDLADQSVMSLEHHSVRLNHIGNPRIRTLRPPRFIANHQNSIPITRSQNLIMPEYQNDFQAQQPQFPMGPRQHLQNETQNMIPLQDHRRKINKRRNIKLMN